ncbi:MAG: DUF4446 family protein [Candidatus Paceibacterota bacterium]|jgi:hypothetical protein
MDFFLQAENIPFLALTAVSLILAGLVIYMHVRLSRVLKGKSGNDLEGSIVSIADGVKELERFREESEKYLADLERRVRRSSQGVETVRFNAFGGGGNGGNQSFATAILSQSGDGVVFSSIYSRERVSVFAKPVKRFISEYELSDEEQSAIRGAKEKLS